MTTKRNRKHKPVPARKSPLPEIAVSGLVPPTRGGASASPVETDERPVWQFPESAEGQEGVEQAEGRTPLPSYNTLYFEGATFGGSRGSWIPEEDRPTSEPPAESEERPSHSPEHPDRERPSQASST